MIVLLTATLAAAAQPAPAPAPRSAPAIAPPTAEQAVVAQITRLEQQWGEAFVKGDFDLLERIVAPEYPLVGVEPDGTFRVTHRAQWMKNSRAFTHHGYAIETVDVNRAGDTAVASAQGLWTVTFRPGDPPQKRRFFVTDTWIRRGGQGQVIERHSVRLPDAAWPPAPPREAPAP